MPAKAGIHKILLYLRQLLIILLTFLSVECAYAESTPQSVSNDARIQVANYDPNQVYRLTSKLGYTTAIEFGADEKILSVNLGDSTSWLVTVQNDIINLKPTSDHANTNMNVLTTRGTYQFFLTTQNAGSRNKPAFLLRFRYPSGNNPLAQASTPGCIRNANYTARGDASVAPRSVYDDGKFTYFDFSGQTHIPAIFLVDEKGNESVVNYHVNGQCVVVETIGKQFTLRDGDRVASVFNEAAK